MEVQGTIYAVSQIQKGESNGKEWQKLEFVVQYENSQYPRSIALTIFGQDKINQFAPLLTQGNQVHVMYDVQAREYNGKWFNSINAWKVEAPMMQVPQQPMFQPQPQPAPFAQPQTQPQAQAQPQIQQPQMQQPQQFQQPVNQNPFGQTPSTSPLPF